MSLPYSMSQPSDGGVAREALNREWDTRMAIEFELFHWIVETKYDDPGLNESFTGWKQMGTARLQAVPARDDFICAVPGQVLRVVNVTHLAEMDFQGKPMEACIRLMVEEVPENEVTATANPGR